MLFTIGDEPNLKSYPSTALKEITGNGDVSTFTDREILEKAQEKWDVYHIMPGKETRGAREYWKDLLGQNLIWVDKSEMVADAIRDIVIAQATYQLGNVKPQVIVDSIEDAATSETPENGDIPSIML